MVLCLLHHHLAQPPGVFFLRVLLLALLAILLVGANQTDFVGGGEWHNPWSPQDELRPFRLREKRLHDRGLAKRQNNEGRPKAVLSADWEWPKPEREVPLDELPLVSPHTELVFHANDTRLHVRTDTWMMRHGQCMEARFRVEGKRTRFWWEMSESEIGESDQQIGSEREQKLLLYTCNMAEGGLCVLDKFLATTAEKHFGGPGSEPAELDSCHVLRPWMFLPSPFSFHVRFVRRPRRFADRATMMRHWRRRHGRHATREVGRVRLNGFRACERACSSDQGGDANAELQGIPLAGADYAEDPRQGWRRRRR